MKKQLLIFMLLIALSQLIGSSVAENVSSLEIRGRVATDSDTWTADDFAGFYYDLDDDIKTEELATKVTDGKLAEPDGATYTTTAMAKDFEFEDWGQYNVIGFMAEKYFAGYIDTPDTTDDVLFEKSDDENVLSDEQLLKILMDDDVEMTVTSGTPLKLEEGYVLTVKSIDYSNGEVFVELAKNGTVVSSKVVAPSKIYASVADKTFSYKKSIGDSKDVVIIAAHFKNAFSGSGQDMVTIDGLWQLSDTPKDVSENTQYDKMTIQTVTADRIIMSNEDNDIALRKNIDISLMPGIRIKTADADEFRYYIYKDIYGSGTYEKRGSVANDSATWTADNFAGFYYDFDDNIKTEQLTTTITDRMLLEPDGIVYSTVAQNDAFDYPDWGHYKAIGLLGKKYFAGYIEDDLGGTSADILADADISDLLGFGLLTEILIDKSQKTVQDLSSPIDLKEGYSLKLTVGSNKKGLLAELFKDEKLVDKEAVLLPGAYVYTATLGNATGVPLIAADFQEPIFLESKSYFKINGLWQISENPISVREGDHYGIMMVSSIDSAKGIITLNNKGIDITLSNDKNIPIMDGMFIKTADPGWDEGDVLRYYLYSEADIDRSPEGTEIAGGKT